MKPKKSSLTINQYTEMVFANKVIKEALTQFYAARTVSDILVDSCKGMVDIHVINFATTEEKEVYEKVIKDMDKSAKLKAYDRLVDTLREKILGFGKDEDAIERVSLSVFYEFCRQNKKYLLYDTLPYLKGVTTTDVPLSKVFSLFSWIFIDNPFCTTHGMTRLLRKHDRLNIVTAYTKVINYDQTGAIILLYDTEEWGNIKIDDVVYESGSLRDKVLKERFGYLLPEQDTMYVMLDGTRASSDK
jgi:hypothetical protein